MKQYKIFESSNGSREAVKQGWSWPACFFSFFWAFWKRMYGAGVLLLGAGILLALMSTKVEELFRLGDKTARDMDHLYQAAKWILIMIIAVNGNELREQNLLARGYEFRCTLAADSPAEALAIFREQPNVKVPRPG